MPNKKDNMNQGGGGKKDQDDSRGGMGQDKDRGMDTDIDRGDTIGHDYGTGRNMDEPRRDIDTGNAGMIDDDQDEMM